MASQLMKFLWRTANHNASIKLKNKEKDANNEAEYDDPTITYDSVVKEPRYFNILECG